MTTRCESLEQQRQQQRHGEADDRQSQRTNFDASSQRCLFTDPMFRLFCRTCASIAVDTETMRMPVSLRH